ncbi:MAG: TOTE conflict system archaeo-eukaryotic primase domain-containing protein, partial [Terriglobales bacterium]
MSDSPQTTNFTGITPAQDHREQILSSEQQSHVPAHLLSSDQCTIEQVEQSTDAGLSPFAHCSLYRESNTYTERFVNRDDVYFEQWRSGQRYGLRAVRGQVTAELIEKHLQGHITISVPAMSKNATCKWCAWDSDIVDGSIDRIATILDSLKWHPIREGKRSGRDGHLWLFFDSPVSAADLILFDKEIRRRCGIADRVLEFFPKQSKAEIGSALRLPLGVHRKPGANNSVGWFAGPPEDRSAQLAWFAEQALNPA